MPFYPPASGGGSGTVTSVTATTSNAVNNSDAANPIINDATAAQAGTESAAQFVKVTNYDFNSWYSGAVTTMKTAVPALTNFWGMKLGTFPSGVTPATAATNDAQVAGGGMGNIVGGGAQVFTNSLTLTPKTTSWAMAWRAKLITSVAGAFNFIGFIDVTNGHDYGIATFSTDDATKYLIYTYNGAEKFTASSLACDDAFHTFVLTFDGTTLTLFVDGVSKATQTDLSKMTDEAVFPTIEGTVANANKATMFAYGYIAP